MERKLFILFALLCLTVSGAWASTRSIDAIEVDDASTCGDGLVWYRSDDNKTLNIEYSGSGTGVMDNFDDPYSVPWYDGEDNCKLYYQIENIVVGPGVKTIGNYAFFDLPKLASVSLPEGLESIGKSAFCNLLKVSPLTSITIPNGVKSIGITAFSCCRKLSQVTLPATLETIGDGAFLGCSNLASITIPAGVTSIDSDAFAGTGLKSVTVYAHSCSLSDDDVFDRCYDLKSIYVFKDRVHYYQNATNWSAYKEKIKAFSVTASGDEMDNEHWATYYNDQANVTVPHGTQVFKVALTGSTLEMTEITDRIINKGEGVVLKSIRKNIELASAASGTTDEGGYSGNSLVGTMTAVTNPGNAYTLDKRNAGVGFYKLSDTETIGANEAYLTYSGSDADAHDFFSLGVESTPEDPGAGPYWICDEFITNKAKDTYESDYIKITCTVYGYTGMWLGVLQPIDILSKHNAKIKKVKFTTTHADAVSHIRCISKGEYYYSYDGKSVTIDNQAENNYTNFMRFQASSYLGIISINHVEVWFEPTELAPNADGEYSIENRNEWDLFCKMVNEDGNTFSGKKVNLKSDITEGVTTMAGHATNIEQVFSGTFDGQGHTLTVNLKSTENRCSPFRVVKDGTIQNLRVAGIIKCQNYSGGIIGATENQVTLSNCCSDVDIIGIGDEGRDIGGLIGCVNSTSSLNVEGCSFTGTMDTSGQAECGGMVGWIYSDKACTFTNCIVKPSYMRQGSNSNTFANRGSFDNCYYSTLITNPQGKKAHAITTKSFDGTGSFTMENVGTPATEYPTSGITAYPAGIKFDNQAYAGLDDVVSLELTPQEGFAISGVDSDYGTLSGDRNRYSLTMPDSMPDDKDVTITALIAKGYNVSVKNLMSGETMILGFTTDMTPAVYDEGATVTLTATVAPNVVLKSVTLIPESYPTNTRTATQINDTQYQFYMPASNITVTYDYYVNNGPDAYYITWAGGEGTKMVAQVNGITMLNANAGDKVTVTLSDGEKRQATGVTVTGAMSGNEVAVTQKYIGENEFTFTMPAEAVTVSAESFKYNIIMMTAGHCTIEASVEGGEPTVVTGLMGATVADPGNKVTLTVNPTIDGEAVSHTLYCYTTAEGEYIETDATKVDDTHYEFTMPATMVTVYPFTAYTLADDADNSSFLASHNGKTHDMMLKGRTLNRDGNWTTLCLPFDLKAIDFDASLGDKATGDTHPLNGATVMVLDTENWFDVKDDETAFHTGFFSDDATLYFYFTAPEPTESGVVIPAGTPFVIKWEGEYMGDPIVNPTISRVTIENAARKEVAYEGGTFVGSFSPFSVPEENTNILFLSDDNKLYFPSAETTLGAFRAYFEMKQHAEARNFVVGFGDSETTGITELDNGTISPFDDSSDNSQIVNGQTAQWYDLQGRRIERSTFNVQRSTFNVQRSTFNVQRSTLKKGIYIKNGRKVVIK